MIIYTDDIDDIHTDEYYKKLNEWYIQFRTLKNLFWEQVGGAYMDYWWQGWSLNVITWGEHNKILLSTWNENPNKPQNLFTQKVMTSQLLGHFSLTPSPSPPVN